MDAEKFKHMQSPGEMAILFMGISKVAHEVLLKNPHDMSNECIFTRILGNPEVENGDVWRDSS